MLTLILLNPGKEWTLSDLASRIQATVSSVQREVVRAEQAGVITSRRLGNTRLVAAARSPLTGPLTELLLRSFGPRQVLAEELAAVEESTTRLSSARGRRGTLASQDVRQRIWTSWRFAWPGSLRPFSEL